MEHSKAPKYEEYINEQNNNDFRSIPGDNGLPFIGHSHRFYVDPLEWAQERYAKYGPISKVKALNGNGILVLGPELMQQVYLDPTKNFSSKMGFMDRVGIFFGGSVIMEDFDEHKIQRRILQTAFKSETLRQYTDDINAIYDRSLNEWEDDVGGTIKIFCHIKTLLLEVAATLFIGVTDRGETMEKINQSFVDCLNGLMYLLPLNVPGTTLYKGLKGKQYLQDYMGGLIAGKRAGSATDMLSHFCREKNEEGEFFSDEEIINQAIFLLFAAHDTTTAAITHTIYYLAKHPDVKEKLYQECLTVGKAQLNYDDLDKVPYMQQVFFEVQRCRTSTPIVPRRTIREIVLSGIRIPAHTMVFTVPGFTNHMSDYWTEPEKFDPDRFSPERAEHKGHAFMFHPFGGGAHKCIGMHFSQMEYKCFLFKFLLTFDFEARHKKEPRMQTLPLPKPADDMPIELFKRK